MYMVIDVLKWKSLTTCDVAIGRLLDMAHSLVTGYHLGKTHIFQKSGYIIPFSSALFSNMATQYRSRLYQIWDQCGGVITWSIFSKIFIERVKTMPMDKGSTRVLGQNKALFNKHSIGHPPGWDMGCLSWVHTLIWVIPKLLCCYMEYHFPGSF